MDHAGLDAFVFLGFFKMAIKLLGACTFFGVTIISPIRLHFTGRLDQDDDEDHDGSMSFLDDPEGGVSAPEDYKSYLWTYVIFTYFFTFLTAYFMMQQTLKVIRVRQKYLGRQNSITDRTIRVSGVAEELRTDDALRDHIEMLDIGNVRNISLCRNWAQLDALFDKRDKVIGKLERAYSEYLGPTWANEMDTASSVHSLPTIEPHEPVLSEDDDYNTSMVVSEARSYLNLRPPHGIKIYKRPLERLGLLGWFGKQVDVIDHYTTILEELDSKIADLRRADQFPSTSTAFVTMDSVASAQMTAQAVLDPRPYTLIGDIAPAPHDVIWRNLYMSKRERMIRTWTITFIIAIMSVAMVVPVTYLAGFLEIKTIKKFWPALAKVLEASPALQTLVTGILPPFLFTLFNFLVPYIYVYLSSLQGFVSYGEVELSIISKNFFYVFFNMFLVFTAGGTARNFIPFLKDTTKIAYELAKILRGLSRFYINLVILQGIGMFPLRLVQLGSVVQFPLFAAHAKSPRDYRNLYKPPILNYGIHLPQPILILIIVLMYSVMSTKILFFGLLYFTLGYFVYKYQVIYVMVHPQHSTGRAWPLIFRRVCVGLILFHLSMGGLLALQSAYVLAPLLAPLPIMTLTYWYNFERTIGPLLKFIALQAIETEGSSSGQSTTRATSNIEESSETEALLRRPRSASRTLDEQRERGLKYINPNLVRPLDGPWIGLEGDEVILANSEGTVRRKMRFEEWE